MQRNSNYVKEVVLPDRIEQAYVPVERPPQGSTRWRLSDKLTDQECFAIVAAYEQAGSP